MMKWLTFPSSAPQRNAALSLVSKIEIYPTLQSAILWTIISKTQRHSFFDSLWQQSKQFSHYDKMWVMERLGLLPVGGASLTWRRGYSSLGFKAPPSLIEDLATAIKNRSISKIDKYSNTIINIFCFTRQIWMAKENVWNGTKCYWRVKWLFEQVAIYRKNELTIKQHK